MDSSVDCGNIRQQTSRWEQEDMGSKAQKAGSAWGTFTGCPHLSQLKMAWELDKMKGLKLEELWLEGNPLCSTFPDHSVYDRYIMVSREGREWKRTGGRMDGAMSKGETVPKPELPITSVAFPL